jgi:hypothetical protein
MKATTKFRFSNVGHKSLYRALAVSLVLMVVLQTATAALSDEQEASPTSTQQSTAANNAAKSQVLQIRRGSFVEVQLMTREKLRGRLGELGDESFVLRTVSNNKLMDLHVRYEDLRSVRPLGDSQTRGDAFDKNVTRAGRVMGVVAGAMGMGLMVYRITR